MVRYLLAALCAVLMAAAPTTKPVRYTSPERVISSIPNNLMPVSGRSWDELANERVSQWLKDHAVGCTVTDTTPPRTKIEPYHPRKQSEEQGKRFATSYQYNVTSHGLDFSIVVNAYFNADQEPIIAKLRDGERARFTGTISDAKVVGSRHPSLVLVVTDAKIAASN